MITVTKTKDRTVRQSQTSSDSPCSTTVLFVCTWGLGGLVNSRLHAANLIELGCCKHPRTRIVTGVMKEENPSTQHFYRSSPFVLFSDDNEDESLGQHAPCLTYLLYKYLFASWKKPGEAKQGLETISKCQSLSCVVFFIRLSARAALGCLSGRGHGSFR